MRTWKTWGTTTDEVPYPYRVCLNTAHKMCRKMCAEDVPPEGNASASNTWSQWFQVTSHSFSDLLRNTSGAKAQNVAKNACKLNTCSLFLLYIALTSDCDWIVTAFVTAHGSWTVSALRQAVQSRQCRHFLTSVVKKKTQGYPLIPLELLNKGLLDKFWKIAGTPTPPHQQPSFFWRLLNAQGVDVYASGHDVSVYPFHWSKGTLTAVLCSQPEQCEQPTVSLFIDLFGWKNASSSESVTSGETTEIELCNAEKGFSVCFEGMFLFDWPFFCFWDPMHILGSPTCRRGLFIKSMHESWTNNHTVNKRQCTCIKKTDYCFGDY